MSSLVVSLHRGGSLHSCICAVCTSLMCVCVQTGEDHLSSVPRPVPLAEVEKEPMEPRRPWPEEVDLRTRVKA